MSNPNYCENFRAILVAFDGNKKLITRTRCKQWSCEFCANINRTIWRAKIINGINEYDSDDWCWFTLTAHSRTRTASSSLSNLRGAWDVLIKRMKRKYGKFAYVRVYEEHANGAYHLHAIGSFAFGDIKTRKGKDGSEVKYSQWLAENAVDLSLGYYTHADDMKKSAEHHAGYVASYVTKYIVKMSPQFKEDLGRIRHIQTSQNWPKLPERGNMLDWELKTGYYIDDFVNDTASGVTVVDINTGVTVTSDNFLDTYIYPPDFAHTPGD